jgi:hypothetical protein
MEADPLSGSVSIEKKLTGSLQPLATYEGKERILI